MYHGTCQASWSLQAARSKRASFGLRFLKSKGCSVRGLVHSSTVLFEGSNQQMRTVAGKVLGRRP